MTKTKYLILFGIFCLHLGATGATLNPPQTMLASSFEESPSVDPDANGEMLFYRNVAISTPVSFPTADTYRITINARGADAGGVFPKMAVYVDNVLISTVDVASRTAKDFVVSYKAVAGTSRLKLAFINDLWLPPTQDRNLFVKSVSVANATLPQTIPFSSYAPDLRVRTAGTVVTPDTWQLTTSGSVGDDFVLTAGKKYDFVVWAYGTPDAGLSPDLQVYIDNVLIKTLPVTALGMAEHRFSYPLQMGGTRRIRFSLGNPTATGARRLNLGKIAVSVGSATGGTVPTTALLTYDFTAGDTLAPKAGWSFDTPAWPVTPAAASPFKGLAFTYPGTLPGHSARSELRFRAPPNDQFWIQLRLHVPSNYTHRADTKIDLPADQIDDWQVGDHVRGIDGVSAGVISSVSTDIRAGSIFLRNPDRREYNSTWVGSLHNMTRDQSAISTGRAMWPSGSGLFSMWADGMGRQGLGPTIVWAMHPAKVPMGQTATASHLAVRYARGNREGADNHIAASNTPFIASSDLGKYIDVAFHGKFSSKPGATDGVIQTWVRKESATQFTLMHNVSNVVLNKPVELAPNLQQWQSGFFMGLADGGFDQDTTLHISKVQYFKDRPPELIPPVVGNPDPATPVDPGTPGTPTNPTPVDPTAPVSDYFFEPFDYAPGKQLLTVQNKSRNPLVIWRDEAYAKTVTLSGEAVAALPGLKNARTNFDGVTEENNKALLFTYLPTPEPWSEQRFDLNMPSGTGTREIWIQYDQFIPDNFKLVDPKPTSGNYFGGGSKVFAVFADGYSEPYTTMIFGGLFARKDASGVPAYDGHIYSHATLSTYQNGVRKFTQFGIDENQRETNANGKWMIHGLDEGHWQRRTLHLRLPNKDFPSPLPAGWESDKDVGVVQAWVKRHDGKVYTVINTPITAYGFERNYFNRGYINGYVNHPYLSEKMYVLVDNFKVSTKPFPPEFDMTAISLVKVPQYLPGKEPAPIPR